jgi:hypothetical protein
MELGRNLSAARADQANCTGTSFDLGVKARI